MGLFKKQYSSVHDEELHKNIFQCSIDILIIDFANFKPPLKTTRHFLLYLKSIALQCLVL